jgi:nucleotide-binding universal stress UspA family protein
MYKVLVPIDESVERAMGQAKYVTSLPNADGSVEAILMYVFGKDGDVPEEYQRFKSATRIKSVKEASEHLEEHGIEVTVVDDSGEAAQDILDHAEENDVNAIVLGGRKRSPTRKAIFGSVTQEVILNTERPVVVTGGSQPGAD